MNSRQLLAYALYRIQLKSAVIALFAYSIFVFSLSNLSLFHFVQNFWEFQAR